MLRKAAFIYGQPQELIRLFFPHPTGADTEIESDADLLALKYMIHKEDIVFRVQISKTKQQIEKELISEVVGEYLHETYDAVAEQEFQREVNSEIDSYLDRLYRKVAQRAEKEKLKKVENKEIDNYMSRMMEEISDRKIFSTIPVRARKSRFAPRVSPERELFRRKEGHIESMVSKILESMMPVMVKELSYRIVEELKMGRDESSDSSVYSDFEDLSERELNPEEY
jgi:hypothetical protein